MVGGACGGSITADSVACTMKRTIVLIVLALVCTVSYMWLDIPVAVAVHQSASPWIRLLGAFLEELGKSQWFLVPTLVITIATWHKRSTSPLPWHHGALFMAIAVSGIAANIIKVLASRARPPLLFSTGEYGFNWLALHTDFAHNSFPSGHATTGLALAVVGAMIRPQWRVPFVCIGMSIAVGRVLANVHYLSDVLAGSALGATVAWWVVQRMQAHPSYPNADR
jgi:membrane-associated phospholipid phosphatase